MSISATVAWEVKRKIMIQRTRSSDTINLLEFWCVRFLEIAGLKDQEEDGNFILSRMSGKCIVRMWN